MDLLGLERYLLQAGAGALAARHELRVKMPRLRGGGHAVNGFTDCGSLHIIIVSQDMDFADISYR